MASHRCIFSFFLARSALVTSARSKTGLEFENIATEYGQRENPGGAVNSRRRPIDRRQVLTLRGDEAVDLSEQQRVLGFEQLDPGDLGTSPSAASGTSGGRRRCVPGGAGGGLISSHTEDD